MFKSIAEILLKSKIAEDHLSRKKKFIAWNDVQTIALLVSAGDNINKSALDKFIDQTQKLVTVFYIETNSKMPTYSDWQCFCKKDSSFLGLPRGVIQQELKTKKFDLVINTCNDDNLFATALTTTIPATLKCGHGKKFNELDLIIQKSDPYHLIDYLNDVVKYLKMIRSNDRIIS